MAVAYRGVPEVVTDPDQSIEGWVPTDDGAFVVGEPQGSPGWFPCNDNPRDKATFDFAVTVPAGPDRDGQRGPHLVGNERRQHDLGLEGDGPDGDVSRDVDARQVRSDSVDDGERAAVYIAVDPQLAKGQVLSKLTSRSILRLALRAVPFNSVGAIVDSAKIVGYSLETQTKPNFPYVPNEATLVHELSHMWFGDSVTLTQWPDMWLHEGFATWSEWIWSEHQGNKSRSPVVQAALQHAGPGHTVLDPAAGNPGTASSSSTERSTTAAG